MLRDGIPEATRLNFARGAAINGHSVLKYDMQNTSCVEVSPRRA